MNQSTSLRSRLFTPSAAFKFRSFQKLALLLGTCALFAAPAHAQTRPATFWNTTTGSFGTSTNWSAGQPSMTVDAKIDNGGTAMVTAGTPAPALYVYLASTTGSTGNMQVSGTGYATFTSVNVGHQGTATLNISSGGVLSSYGGTLGSYIGGVGTAMVDGAGTKWNITGPEMRIGSVGTGTLTLRNGSSLNVASGTGKITLAGERISTGDLYIGTGGVPGIVSAAEITSGTGKATVIFNHNSTGLDFSAKFTGIKSFDGYLNIRQEAGTTILSAAESNMAGLVTVAGGTLLVTGSIKGSVRDTLGDEGTVITETNIGETMVMAGGTLGGNGFLEGKTTVLGTLTPGMGLGILKFGGDLELKSSSVLTMQLGGLTRGTGFDAIDAAGAFTYGGTLHLELANGFVPTNGATFDLFNGYSSFSGSFTSIVFDSPDYSGSFNPQTGVLSVTVVPEPGSACLAAVSAAWLLTRRGRRMESRTI